ncbi:hypothetical protein Ahy_B02g060945 [Arachis hypogaea]|uniref:No apical meristem-associated C-terminal domain-containing protein n=1 Tax=Arachis hypogaea TaxID=3818 RepID=A0A445AJN9_ARAHY|nr:hypothetical protein Ahy_B02g060945 [Arachis hypogaea]
MFSMYIESRAQISFIELYIEFEQSEADRNILRKDYNSDSEEEFESNYEVVSPNENEDQGDGTVALNVTDVANTLANEVPFEEPSFMRVLDLEAMHAPEFPDYMSAGDEGVYPPKKCRLPCVYESEPLTFYAKCTQYESGCGWLIRMKQKALREEEDEGLDAGWGRKENASRHNTSSVGGSSNTSSHTPIQSSLNSQYSNFANPCGLDAIDLNDDDIEDRRQDNIQHWHWKEDEMLISAWLNVSTDPIVGTDQKGEIFWSRIHSYCVEFCSDMTRGVVACKKRWYKINKVVAQFACCYDQASRNIRSGSNADDIKELEQKWRSQLPTQSSGSKRTKVSATGAYSSSSNPEIPLADELGVDSPVRPQGSKKSKRKGKKKAQMCEDFSEKKSLVVNKLSLMEDIKNVREKELMDREKEREEEKEHRAKIMAIKEKELQIQVAMKEQELQAQAAMKEQELQTQRYIKEMEIKAKERKMESMAKEREREMDMQILNADTSTMSEKRRALHDIACEKIIAK